MRQNKNKDKLKLYLDICVLLTSMWFKSLTVIRSLKIKDKRPKEREREGRSLQKSCAKLNKTGDGVT